MRFAMGKTVAMALLAGAGMAGAHLTDGSLKFDGKAAAAGDSFTEGASVTIGWQVAVSHGTTINLDISTDGGTTWSSIKAGLTDAAGAATFKATVPSQATTHAKVRVCQGTATACASIKVSQPSTAPYTLMSPEFSITGTSALRAPASQGFAFGFDARSGIVSTSFELARPGEVSVQAFDPQGRLLAEMIRAPFAAGQYHLSLKTPRGLKEIPVMLFRVKVGETVRVQAFARP